MIPDLGRYAFEVALAYLGSLSLLAGVVALSVWQARRVRRGLEEAEKRALDG